MPKVISIGNTCLDIILTPTDHLPRWNSEIVFPRCEWRLGGQGTNFAIATALLGFKPILVSSIGTDGAGNQLHSELSMTKSINKRFLLRRTIRNRIQRHPDSSRWRTIIPHLPRPSERIHHETHHERPSKDRKQGGHRSHIRPLQPAEIRIRNILHNQ